MYPLNINDSKLRFHALIGTGGIGSGSFFLLNGNHTLGREESRSGRFIDRRDYCKLHIVSHYVKVLLGRTFETFPAGKVGDDDTGGRLYDEMAAAGLNMRYVEKSKNDQTLFSFCFMYPDGSGGNMTTDNSACSKVTPAYICKTEPSFKTYRGKGIALAVPEASLAARQKILELGTGYSFFRAASFSSQEMKDVRELNLFQNLDLLAVNIDEAAKAAGLEDDTGSPEQIVKSSIEVIKKLNPDIYISITAGKRGSWVWDGRELGYIPALSVNTVSTAGAGDAFLAGLICGLTAGLRLIQAHELGSLTGALSVTSPHTIHKGINRKSLYEFAAGSGIKLPEPVRVLIEDSGPR